jgi:general secretion pathway protein F
VPHALSRYVEYRQRLDNVRGTVVGALVYPVILGLVGLAVTTFLLLYVVPRFAVVYQGTGRSLPWLTEQMLAWGRLASEHSAGVAMLAALGVAASVFVTWRGVRSGRLVQVLLHLPVLGEHVRLYGLSRLYLTVSMLLANGLPIRAAIDAAVTVVPHKLRSELLAARDDIVSGQAISTAFRCHGLTTVISARLLQAGEHAGDLARMFEQAAAFYESSNARFLQRFTRAFEPLLMVAIGLVVGVIVLLLYMPIFDLAASVQ